MSRLAFLFLPARGERRRSKKWGGGKLMLLLFHFKNLQIVMAILLFLVPNKMAEEQKLMDWSTCKQLPWDVILLLGGGT
jgi:di/tricarboxylate transporter